MDLFKLGLRSVLGITLPGAMLVLVFCYIGFSTALAFDQPVLEPLWGKDQQLFAFSVLFLVSYIVGSLLRLNSADQVDKRSSERQLAAWRKSHSNEKALTETRERVLSGDPSEIPEDFDDWIWLYEPFPYTTWQLRKFQIWHPPEVQRFFQGYRSCMAGSKGSGKEFFNYCKMVIYHSSRSAGDPIVDEVYFAEATVRFYAGTYTGLRIASWALLFLLAMQVALLALPIGMRGPAMETRTISLAVTIFLLVVVAFMSRAIVLRFRRLRLKEVDTVYDAFYLVHRHAESCEKCLPASPHKPSKLFAQREMLLRGLFPGRGVMLDRLLEEMRKRGSTNRDFSYLYFAGAELDHPFFLRNDKVAVGISVLPQDAEKASISKRHPHQKEVLFILEGSLRLEIEEDGKLRGELLREGDVFVIQPGQCHRILPVDGQSGAFLFVKTQPAREPRGEACHLPSSSG